MGFSQGGFATWNLLCLASDVICSAAPLAASGLDAWGVGYGDQCFTGSGPQYERSVFYTSGFTDPLAIIVNAARQVENVKNVYGLDGGGVDSSGSGYSETTWTSESDAGT